MQDDLCHQSKQGRIYVALMTLSQLASTVADTLEAHIEQAGKLVADCLLTGNKVLACGNGGSAADAQHFVAELVGRMSRERRALAAVSLEYRPVGGDSVRQRLWLRACLCSASRRPRTTWGFAAGYFYQRVFRQRVAGYRHGAAARATNPCPCRCRWRLVAGRL